jgi:hypothetical protein
MVDGGVYIWRFKQPVGGGELLTFGTKFKFPGGVIPALSPGGNDVDRLTGVYDATDDVIECVLNNDFA